MCSNLQQNRQTVKWTSEYNYKFSFSFIENRTPYNGNRGLECVCRTKRKVAWGHITKPGKRIVSCENVHSSNTNTRALSLTVPRIKRHKINLDFTTTIQFAPRTFCITMRYATFVQRSIISSNRNCNVAVWKLWRKKIRNIKHPQVIWHSTLDIVSLFAYSIQFVICIV